jgi:integrase
LEYKANTYRREQRLPYIPSEQEIDSIIASSSIEYSAYFQLLKETAYRPSEALSLTPLDIDLERRIIRLNKPQKGSKSRQSKISAKLALMLSPLIRSDRPNEPIWKVTEHSVAKYLNRLKRRLSEKLADSKFTLIIPYTFRHWKACQEYARTKDIIYIMNLLGHKSLKNVLYYVQLINVPDEDAYICKIASSIDEASRLVESGFEYVTAFENRMLFRKRK